MNESTDIRTHLLLTSVGYRFVLPTLGILLGILCVIFNSLVGAFFSTKTQQVTHLIYFSLACSDMVSGFVAIYQGVAVMLAEVAFPDARMYLYSLFYIVGQLSFHVSAFINVLLTVARTTSIFFPMYAIKNDRIKLCMLVYTLVWAVLILAEWIVAHNVTEYLRVDKRAVVQILYVYPRPGGLVVDEIIYQTAGEETWARLKTLRKVLVMLVGVFIPYGLPSLICLVSAILQVKQIFHNTHKPCTKEKSQQRNRKMTVTIILLTTVFFVCNTAYLVAVILDIFVEIDQFLLLVASNHLLYLNSALTPLILILRGRTMFEYVRSRINTRTTSRVSKGSLTHSFKSSLRSSYNDHDNTHV